MKEEKKNNNTKHLFLQLKQYRNKRNFFEMMRFDLIIDDNLRVYLMEANMSPNLSSSHFQQNTLLYEQVIYNLMSLVGIGSSIYRESLRTRFVIRIQIDDDCSFLRGVKMNKNFVFIFFFIHIGL